MPRAGSAMTKPVCHPLPVSLSPTSALIGRQITRESHRATHEQHHRLQASWLPRCFSATALLILSTRSPTALPAALFRAFSTMRPKGALQSEAHTSQIQSIEQRAEMTGVRRLRSWRWCAVVMPAARPGLLGSMVAL
jgi:hypothetical protein